jgi:hypothetical protein
MKRGEFYSSQGPEIHDIAIHGDAVTIACSPATWIVAAGPGTASRCAHGQDLERATLPLDCFGEQLRPHHRDRRQRPPRLEQPDLALAARQCPCEVKRFGARISWAIPVLRPKVSAGDWSPPSIRTDPVASRCRARAQASAGARAARGREGTVAVRSGHDTLTRRRQCMTSMAWHSPPGAWTAAAGLKRCVPVDVEERQDGPVPCRHGAKQKSTSVALVVRSVAALRLASTGKR